jgi:hypothetical protein
VADWFHREFNTVRSHSAMDHMNPKLVGDECDRQLHDQALNDKKYLSDP